MKISKRITVSVGVTACSCGAYEAHIPEYTESIPADGESATSTVNTVSCASCGKDTEWVGIQSVEFDI
jgi:hypothetical protein